MSTEIKSMMKNHNAVIFASEDNKKELQITTTKPVEVSDTILEALQKEGFICLDAEECKALLPVLRNFIKENYIKPSKPSKAILKLFSLSMPNIGSWNGRWSGENMKYQRVVKCSVPEGNYHYNFGDGWSANVNVTNIDSAMARKARRESAGFCGYDWMIDSIILHGEIKSSGGVKLIKVIKRTYDELKGTYSDEIIEVPENWDFSKPSYEQEDLFYVNCGSNQSIIESEI